MVKLGLENSSHFYTISKDWSRNIYYSDHFGYLNLSKFSLPKTGGIFKISETILRSQIGYPPYPSRQVCCAHRAIACMRIRLCTTCVQRCLCPGLCPFLSPEPTILLACGRDRELWPGWLRIRNEYSVHTQTQGRRIVDSGDENGLCRKWIAREIWSRPTATILWTNLSFDWASTLSIFLEIFTNQFLV